VEPRAEGALADLLCFDLYTASRSLTGLYRTVLAELDLTYPQYLVMVELWRHRACPIKTVVTDLGLDYSTLTPLLQRLAAKGLVQRDRGDADERSVVISLTVTGAALEERGSHVQEQVRAAMGLDADAAGALQQALRALTASVTGWSPLAQR